MDPNTALSLILDLYAQLANAQRQIAELTARLEAAVTDMSTTGTTV